MRSLEKGLVLGREDTVVSGKQRREAWMKPGVLPPEPAETREQTLVTTQYSDLSGLSLMLNKCSVSATRTHTEYGCSSFPESYLVRKPCVGLRLPCSNHRL